MLRILGYVAILLAGLTGLSAPASADDRKPSVRITPTVSDQLVTVKVRVSGAVPRSARAVLQRRIGRNWRDAASARLRRSRAALAWQGEPGARVRIRVVLRLGRRVLGTSPSTLVRVSPRRPPPRRPPAVDPPPRQPSVTAAQIVRDVAAGGNHGCEISSAGRVRCWGANDNGQVGDGTTIDQPRAVAVPGLDGVVAVAAGWEHSCALRGDGTVWCWGRADGGRLGGAGGSDVSIVRAPTRVPTLTGVLELLAGGDSTCARDAKREWRCWGSSLTTPGNALTPSAQRSDLDLLALDGGVACWRDVGRAEVRCAGLPRAFPGDALAVSASRNVGCAVRRDGRVECIAAPEQLRSQPVLTLEVEAATDVAVGGTTVCVARRDAEVLCQDLAPLDWDSPPAPARSVAQTRGITELAGDAPMCARLAGEVRCFGRPTRGALGDGRNGDVGVPAPSVLASDVSRIAMDEQQACGIDARGATCWGLTTRGNEERLFAAGPLIEGTEAAIDVAVTGHGACVVTLGATVRCWGTIPANSLAPTTSAMGVGSTATQVADLAGVSAIVGGIMATSTCALRQGQVVCWGGGALEGPWTAGAPRGPVDGFAGVEQLSVASGVCAVIAAGVRCQASDQYGLSGATPTGTISSFGPPATLEGSAGAIDVDLGTAHACMVNVVGEVRCWGRGASGELGRELAGNAEQRATNVLAPVPGIRDARDVAVGSDHTCVIRGSGSVACWGANGRAQLGDLSGVGGAAARELAGIDDALRIDAGGDATCVTRAAHPLTCWGDGDRLPYPSNAVELIATRVVGAP